ncbi:hypothetical protein, partial [Pseudomonas aeruginosa]|uniref:hypothetical protein n=1 Tax=Pseudomonas aeruginosa TaxID=287 RepID=UPI0039935F41
QHRRALQRLLLQQLAEPAKYLRAKLPGQTEMGLLYRELGRVEAKGAPQRQAAGQERLDGELERQRRGCQERLPVNGHRVFRN